MNHQYLLLFALCFVACFAAVGIFKLLEYKVKTGIPLLDLVKSAYKDERLYRLYFVYRAARELILQGKSQEEVQGALKAMIKNRSFDFMRYEDNSTFPKQKRNLEIDGFLEMVINDKKLLFEYVVNSSFEHDSKKNYKDLLSKFSNSEEQKDVELLLRTFLIDSSNENVERCMNRFPLLFVEPFIDVAKNEDDNSKLSAGENMSNIYLYLTAPRLEDEGSGLFLFKYGLSQTKFIDLCKKIKKLNPFMDVRERNTFNKHCNNNPNVREIKTNNLGKPYMDKIYSDEE